MTVPDPASPPASTLPPASVPLASPLAANEWPAWQRFLFRYVLCHWLLYAFPRPANLFLSTLASGVQALAGWLDFDGSQRPWRWPGKWAMELGDVEVGWQHVTTFLWQQGLSPVEVIHQRTGSGDTGHDYVKLAVIVALSLLAATMWSLLSRAKHHARSGRLLHLAVRWDLAFWLLTYGLVKFYGGQFGTPGLRTLTSELGDNSPMSLAWKFMAASKPYELFGGLGEVVGGLLLLHHRTALLGCFVTIAVMANVVALNWLYDVPVKLFSLHLWLYAVGLTAPWWPRLVALFVSNRASSPVFAGVAQRPWLARSLLVFGALWAGGSLVESHLGGMAQITQREQQRMRPGLYGLWLCEKMLVDGVELSAADATAWRFLAIDDFGTAWARLRNGTEVSFGYQEDLAAGKFMLRKREGGKPSLEREEWTFVRGAKVVKVTQPEPRTMQDYDGQVDAERPTLVMKGSWQGKQIELHTVRKVFWLHRGFHFVQEVPVNRSRP